MSRASQPRALPEGAYTYVITREGRLIVGKVDDSFEYGVKHSSLADGREVVAAGELRVRSNGSFEFNNDSGTFVKPLVDQRGVAPEDLVHRSGESLKRFLGQEGQIVNRGLLPKTPPSRDRLRDLCREVPFCAVNAGSCRALFGREACS